jgi:hypothetical protein
VVAVGTPEQVATATTSYTGEVLAPLLGVKRARRKPVADRPKPKSTKRPAPRPKAVAKKTAASRG